MHWTDACDVVICSCLASWHRYAILPFKPEQLSVRDNDANAVKVCDSLFPIQCAAGAGRPGGGSARPAAKAGAAQAGAQAGCRGARPPAGPGAARQKQTGQERERPGILIILGRTSLVPSLVNVEELCGLQRL